MSQFVSVAPPSLLRSLTDELTFDDDDDDDDDVDDDDEEEEEDHWHKAIFPILPSVLPILPLLYF